MESILQTERSMGDAKLWPALLTKAFGSGIRRGRPYTPPIETPRGISSLERVDLNGCAQWLLIRGHDVKKPLLLFLHGGPGSAAIWFAHHSMRELEKHFVCVNWDQRGAGKSYADRPGEGTMNLAQFVDDALALVERLLRRFDQKKLVLVGQSWGSVLAMKIAAARPDLVHLLVGVGQVIDMKRGEEISYQYALDQALRCRNEKAVRQLEAIGHPPYRGNGLFVQRRWLSEYKGDTWSIDVKGVVAIGLRATEYSLADVVRFFLGAKRSIRLLWNELMAVDFPRDVPELSVPVAFFVGRHDYTTPFELVAAHFESLRAPAKKIVWFENSAHMPNLEEPEAFQRELVLLARAFQLVESPELPRSPRRVAADEKPVVPT
jgi:pimeloyl-ACP methyl ester carboxylesterase